METTLLSSKDIVEIMRKIMLKLDALYYFNFMDDEFAELLKELKGK